MPLNSIKLNNVKMNNVKIDAPYKNRATYFDGTSYYGDTTMTQPTSTKGIVSCWFKRGNIGDAWPEAGDFLQWRQSTTPVSYWRFVSSNRVTFFLSAGFNMTTPVSTFNCGYWYWLGISFDNATAVRAKHAFLYEARGSGLTDLSSSLNLSSNDAQNGSTHDRYYIPQASGGIIEYFDMYYNSEEYLDFSVAANRAKFIDSNGKPVYLGEDGSRPTGNQPAYFHSTSTTGQSFVTNRGSVSLTMAKLGSTDAPFASTTPTN